MSELTADEIQARINAIRDSFAAQMELRARMYLDWIASLETVGANVRDLERAMENTMHEMRRWEIEALRPYLTELHYRKVQA